MSALQPGPTCHPQRRGYAVCVLLLFLPGPGPAQDLGAVERQMAERPLEAFTIARAAADKLPAERAQALWARAARLQEDHLAQLQPDQVQELASVYAGTLHDTRAAERVRRDWLRMRREALGAADGPGRLQLARLTWRWLQDRDAAAALCRDALRVSPDLEAAARMLREDLGLESTEAGRPLGGKVTPADREKNLSRVRPGMSPVEVRKLLGEPRRVARQVLYRRYVEQWTYDDPPTFWIEFNHLRGQDPRVLSVHPLVGPTRD